MRKRRPIPRNARRRKRLARQRSNTPGILLFRRRPPSGPASRHPGNELLLVFLVGETPTSGINRIAFDKAWTYATQLSDRPLPVCEAAQNKAKSCIGILGPSFTGSLPSLRALLNKSKGTGYEVFVLNGAVTGENLGTFNPPDIHYCTTIETQSNRWTAFLHFMSDAHMRRWFWGPDVKDFALLAEDETDYGNGAGVPEDLLTLRFPRGIARVRNSSDDLPPSVTPQRNIPYPNLPLVLRDTGQDTLPSFSQRQGPVSQEAVLIELAAALRRERIRYVGIVATDSLDALFLTRAIHALAPNIRIFLFHADLLFTRASQAWGLSGVLAVTSYPLITRNQYYAGAVRPRRTQFPNESAEGEYNACRRMLLKVPARNGSPCSAQIPGRQSDKQDYLLDYAAPFVETTHSHKPAVWVTMLGRNEWWPVAASAAGNESARWTVPHPAPTDTEHFFAESSPRPWYLFCGSLRSPCGARLRDEPQVPRGR